jgi:hypothetical protein
LNTLKNIKLMKKIHLFGLCMLLALPATAQWGKKIKGNGNRVTETRDVGSYEEVSVAGWFDVELVSGQEGTLEVKGEENLLEHLVTEVKNGTLVIKTESGYNLQPSSWRSDGILITVPVQDLSGVSLSGSGDIRGKTRLEAETFSAVMSGSGDIELEVYSEQVEATLSGSGNLIMRGRSGSLTVSVSGSGDVDAYGLEARSVDASVSGSADIRVTVTGSLKARVSGSGDIHYRGNPETIDSKSAGSGDVKKG